jgi:uncharacterized protein with PIN domain
MNIEPYTKCKFPGCEFPIKANQLCHAHYLQMWRTGRLKKLKHLRILDNCSIEHCQSVSVHRGLCKRHLNQIYKFDEIRITGFDKNDIEEKDDHAEVICKRKGETVYVLIDKEDISKVKYYKWHIDGGNYASSSIIGRMSRFLMNLNDRTKEVDHINRNRLDNRKINLRIVTRLGNMQNKSIYKNNSSGTPGVCYHKLTGKWYYLISYEGHTESSTLYDDKNIAFRRREEDNILLKNSKNPYDTFNQIIKRMKEEKKEKHDDLYKNIEKKCANCNKIFMAGNKKRKRNSRYCSLECYWQSRKK